MAVGANQEVFAAAKLSRFCQSTFDYPVSTDDADAFVESVLEFARGHAIETRCTHYRLDTRTALCPTRSIQRRLPAGCAPPTVHWNLPRTNIEPSCWLNRWGLSSADVADRVTVDLAPLAHISFPAVVKDRFSVRWLDGKALFGSVAYAYSLSDSENKVTERLGAAGDVLVQEFVSGLGIGFSCFIAHGRVFLPFQWQRVREVDPRGSASSCRRSVPLDAETVSLSGRLIAQIGFEGIAMVEYKKMKDGRLILMEINGRPWGSISLPVACGIDYPRHLIEWCLQGTLPPLSIPYRENIVCRRIVGELTHLSNLRAGPPPNWPIPYPNYWTSLVTMAVPWLPGVCYDDLWLSDLRPGIAGIGNWFRSRMKGKLGSQHRPGRGSRQVHKASTRP